MAAEPPLLRTKLLRWLLVPLALLLSADTAVSYWISLRFAERAYDHALIEIARELSLYVDGTAEALRFDMPEAARNVIFNDPRDALYYDIADASGTRIAGRPIAPPHVRRTAGESLYDGVIEGRPVRIVELRTGGAGKAVTGYVRIAETKVKRNELAREIMLSTIVPQILLIALAGILVWMGVVRGLSPLLRLKEAVAARSHRDRSPVTVAEVPGEVQPLMDAINGLLERLDAVLTMQNRFVADAAHQLKTPVAALQAQLEIAAKEIDPERMRQALAGSLAGMERLSRLVSQLLALARNEPEAARTMTLAPVDLAELAFEATSEWVDEALKKGIDLGFEGARGGIEIIGDSVRLRELLDNLLDNAVRYTQRGGRITVAVAPTPMPVVSVSDDGPTIPEHERQRIFERFHRILGSAPHGSGLGLAIAREIASLHGARITLADDVDGTGNTFTVCFAGYDPQ